MKSLLIERHCWRGLHIGSDLFDTALVIGFLTFYISNESIADSIREMKKKLGKAKRTLGGKA